MFENLFSRPKPSPPPNEEYNAIIAKQLAANDPEHVLERVRKAHPALFASIERRRDALPPRKKISALKMFIVVALGVYLGTKAAQEHPEHTPPPQSGFSDTVTFSPPFEGRAHMPSPEDSAALDNLVNSLAAEDKAAEAALAQAFLRNYQAGLKMNKQAYEQYGESRMEMGAFYNAMRKNGVTITDKDAVGKALRDEKIVTDAFSSENFPSGDEKQLKEFRKAFIDALVGKEV